MTTLMHYGSNGHGECGAGNGDEPPETRGRAPVTLIAADVTCPTCRGWLPLVVAPERWNAPDPVNEACDGSFDEWLTRQIIAARRKFDTANSLKVRHRSWDDFLLLRGIQQEYWRRATPPK